MRDEPCFQKFLREPGFQNLLHLFPRFKHAPADDSLDSDSFEDDVLREIDWHRSCREAEQGERSPHANYLERVLICTIAAGHFKNRIDTRLICLLHYHRVKSIAFLRQ